MGGQHKAAMVFVEVDFDAAGDGLPETPTDVKSCESIPEWDDETELFWCKTTINAYAIPDGSTWQAEFQRQLSLRKKKAKVLHRHGSEVPKPRQAGRRELGRFPTDPEKRLDRMEQEAVLKMMPSKAGLRALVQGKELVFFRFGGKVFATNSRCPHMGGELYQGEIGDIEDMVEGRKCFIACPVHKFRFDLSTGHLMEGASCNPLVMYKTRLPMVEISPDGKKSALVEVGFADLRDLGEAYFEVGKE